MGGDGTLSEVNASNLVQAGSKSVDLYRSSGGYARLTGSYVQLLAGRSYSFSMDFRSYGTSMYSGDQFELHRPGGVSHGNPVITDIGNNWKRLTRTVSPGSDIQYKIHFAKYKSGHQYIDNGVVLDITDHDGDGIPHYREDLSVAGYGNDPFFLIQVQAKDEENATTEENFVVKLQNVIEDLDHVDDDGDG